MDIEAAVVIPVLDAAAVLGDQLDALATQTFSGRWEVVIADNGSTDDLRGTVDRWSARVPSLRIVDASARRGVAAARNVGVRASFAPKVLLCDADDRVSANWVAEMVAALDRADAVACMADSVGDGSASRSALIRKGNTSFLAGGCCGFTRSAFDLVGGFDESWDRRGGDDAEFSFRLAEHGATFALVPDAFVHVRGRPHRWAALVQAFWWAHEDARLHLRFPYLLPRREWLEVAGAWLRPLWLLATRRPSRRNGESAPEPSRALAENVGRLIGSLRYKTLFL